MHPELMAYTGSYSCSHVARIEEESLVGRWVAWRRLAAGKSISERHALSIHNWSRCFYVWRGTISLFFLAKFRDLAKRN
jgi:hypothetical protein